MARILLSYALSELSGRTQALIPVPGVVTGSAAIQALDRAARTIDSLASWSFLQRIGTAYAVTTNSVAVSNFLTVGGDILNLNKEMKMYAAGTGFQLELVPVTEIRKKTTVWADSMPTAFAYYATGAGVQSFIFNSTFAVACTLQLYYSKRMALPSSDVTTTNQIACELPDNYSDLLVDVAVWQQKEKYNTLLSEIDKTNIIDSLKRFAREYNASIEEIQNINDEAIRRGQ